MARIDFTKESLTELCGAECFSCKKICDVVGPHDKHRADEGHFIMAYSGWSTEGSKLATLRTCE